MCVRRNKIIYPFLLRNDRPFSIDVTNTKDCLTQVQKILITYFFNDNGGREGVKIVWRHWWKIPNILFVFKLKKRVFCKGIFLLIVFVSLFHIQSSSSDQSSNMWTNNRLPLTCGNLKLWSKVANILSTFEQCLASN